MVSGVYVFDFHDFEIWDKDPWHRLSTAAQVDERTYLQYGDEVHLTLFENLDQVKEGKRCPWVHWV